MSKQPERVVYRLEFTAEGNAELLRDGETAWTSDDDPDFAEEFGDDALTPNNELRETDVNDIVAYLIDCDKVPDGARVAVGYPEGIHLIEDEDEDDDELDPDWDDDDDEDNTEAAL